MAERFAAGEGRLETGARVLDVGCGAGRACLAVAKDFSQARVVGLDPDGDSIRQAEAAAAAAGVAGASPFGPATTDDLDPSSPFDLITTCDCIHDFAAPQQTLEQIRKLLKSDGFVIVEPKAADRLEGNINLIATMFYGFSIFHCMTQSLANGGPGLGTCLGPSRTEVLVRSAGFGSLEQLDIKSAVNLFYAARNFLQ